MSQNGREKKVFFLRLRHKPHPKRHLTDGRKYGMIRQTKTEIETEENIQMRILALGDVVGTRTIEYLRERLWDVRKKHGVDFVIANGENATEIRGISARDAKALLDTGVDLITLGNHTYGMRDVYPFLEQSEQIIRPANYPPEAPGSPYVIARVDGWRILCINVNGRAFMDAFASPFDTVDRILAREKGNYDLSVMDIHAEATSEKLAIAHYFDGRVDVLFGTHTHVPTADERILPKGSGYVTDLGMCGPVDGILGTAKEPVIEKFRTLMPVRFAVAEGPIAAHGVLFELDGNRVTSVRRIRF